MSQKVNYSSYVIGFGGSLVLTVLAFGLAVFDILQGAQLIGAIVFLAAVQLMVQLVFFLHLGKEPRPKWGLQVFLFMVLILITIVAGSIWIMNNLDYHGMTRMEVDDHMKVEADKGF